MAPAAGREPSSTVTVAVGDFAQLECGVGGAGSVSWTKDGQEVTSSPPHVILVGVSQLLCVGRES